MNWHQQEIETVLGTLKSSKTGLTSEGAASALAEHGKNEFAVKKKIKPIVIFLNQFRDFMIVILMIAAIVSGIIGDPIDTIIILTILVLNAVIGFVQEYRAEKTMEALRSMTTPMARVNRDGAITEISATELVPGDMVLLEAGQLIPADMRLIEAHSLRIEEAALTGESVPADKTDTILPEQDTPLGDRVNMAYKTTKITNGRGKGIVTETGMKTEIGKIAGMLQTDEIKTPLQVRMADFGKKLTFIVIGICALLFAVGMLRGEPPLQMLLLSITLAVAAIPEALPALITIALAMGAKRLATQNVVVRRLPAVETLGSVTYICSDKTGTLTKNEMTVLEVSEPESGKNPEENPSMLTLGMLLNQDVVIADGDKHTGDPTEMALLAWATEKAGKEKTKGLQEEYARTAEIPFDAERKRMTTIHQHKNEYLVITKGAIESLTELFENKDANEKIEAAATAMASKGMRVIAFGYRIMTTAPDPKSPETIESSLIYAGMAGMIDPPRPEVKAAIEEARSAGITPVMITGDHLLTATAIATAIGILTEGTKAITGTELTSITDDELSTQVENIRVYARVSPEQKLRIVQCLQSKGHFVAMTGDGANDAPSLKTANIGIAMGITGTDVSKEAAHLVLLDDNFATIVKAVKEGRRIYDNIRKFVKYIMACNSAEILIILTAQIVGMPTPLLPMHILWINLVTDGLPGLALAYEKPEIDIMKRQPRPPGESIFSVGVGTHIAWVGILMAVVTLATQQYALHHELAHWQTMVFTVLLFSQLGHVLAIRSDNHYIFVKGFFSNRLMLGTVFLTFALQIGIIYLPVANKLFSTQPLSAGELLSCIGLSAIIFHAVELEKWNKKSFIRKQRKLAAQKTTN